jgi:hypothetical protein
VPSDPTAPGGADERVLALFEGAGPLETPTPGTKAWLANDGSDSRRPVLIKRVPVGLGKARATQALALVHPNIVRTRRWLSEGGHLYVVRDVVRGKNLRQSLAAAGGTRPSPELVRRLLLPVLDALEYAHGRGAAHGGISPDNILITDEGVIVVTDWATADPKAKHHVEAYGGVAAVGGDVKAFGRVLAAYLPTTGAFASVVVRGRIEGLIGRCDTLADLRETINTLEKLAAAPVGKTPENAAHPTATAPAREATVPPGHQPAGWAQRPGPPFATDSPPLKSAPEMVTQLTERPPRIQQGGGGSATLVVRNEGSAPLVVRMVATQHSWLNVRPMELPITVQPGGSERVGFFISAARLTPGEYRSEVYLSANAGGPTAEDLRGGWFKHTSEVRVTVDPPGAGPGGASGGGLPYPADAPKLPAVPGCAGATVLILAAVVLSMFAAFCSTG